MQRRVQPTKRVTVVVSKQQQKQNKSRSNTRKGSAKVRQESIYAPVSIGIPRRTDNRENHFPFKRKEFLSVVRGSVAYNLTSFKINPGDPSTFPWLSKMAQCFESYRLRKCRFVYIPRCSSASPGLVAMSPDMNPKDAAPSSLEEALQNYKSVNDSTWKTFATELTGEMLNKRKSFFCRPLAANADIDLYDCGNLNLITEGQIDGSAVGQLWVEYEGEFLTPEGKPIGNLAPTMLVVGNSGSGITNLNPITNGSNFREQTTDFIEEISGDGTGSVIKFAKAFHGFLNLRADAFTTITAGAPFSLASLDPLKPVLTSLTESLDGTPLAFNSNLNTGKNGVGILNNLIKADPGGRLRLSWVTPELISTSMLSLTSCGL